jgi:hypothetical protein
MPDVPSEFSVVPQHQVIPAAILAEISDFIRTFDRVTGRMTWQTAALREAPVIAQLKRPEVCFFSAWDFHLPPEGGCWLIEFNDNGSGFLFAAIINALYQEIIELRQKEQLAVPAGVPAFEQHIADLIEREAKAFFASAPPTCLLCSTMLTPYSKASFAASSSFSLSCCASAVGGPSSDPG